MQVCSCTLHIRIHRGHMSTSSASAPASAGAAGVIARAALTAIAAGPARSKRRQCLGRKFSDALSSLGCSVVVTLNRRPNKGCHPEAARLNAADLSRLSLRSWLLLP
jgi:hypothetical protein